MNLNNNLNILVTGGAGFLGIQIVKKLISEGYKVSSLSRNKYSVLDDLGVIQYSGDLSKSSDLEQIDFSQFFAIFHVAAKAGVWGKKEDFFQINYEGSKNLFDRAKNCGVKYFIYTSTPSVVFGRDDIINGDETLQYPDKFYTFYAHSKKLAEEYIINNLDETMQGLALRPHLIWGPNDPHILPRLISRAKSGRLRIIGDHDNLVDVIYVDNAARAHIDAFKALMQNKKLNQQAYFIGQDEPVNLWDFINQLIERSGEKKISKSISFKKAYKLGAFFENLFKYLRIYNIDPPMTRFVAMQMAKNHYFSHAKAKNDFNYTCEISTKKGLDLLFNDL